ncbi:MAG: hypothetical protein VKQ33_01635 [Candidatus Sericytochromatia bacterium]|nr:hypothetical protein [Candidatus Sericytochromatia bacterium]
MTTEPLPPVKPAWADAPDGRRLTTVVTPCYNEEGNVEELYRRVKALFAGLP